MEKKSQSTKCSSKPVSKGAKAWQFIGRIGRSEVDDYVEQREVAMHERREQRRDIVRTYRCKRRHRHRCNFEMKIVEPKLSDEAQVFEFGQHYHGAFYRGLSAEQREAVDLALRNGGGVSQARQVMLENAIPVPSPTQISNHIYYRYKQTMRETDPLSYQEKFGKYAKKKTSLPPKESAEIIKIEDVRLRSSSAITEEPEEEEKKDDDDVVDDAEPPIQILRGPKIAVIPRNSTLTLTKPSQNLEDLQAELVKSELERSKIEREKLKLEIECLKIRREKWQLELVHLQSTLGVLTISQDQIDEMQGVEVENPEGYVIENC